MRVLVVEDEHEIARSIKKGLEQERYAVDVSYCGTDGYDLATETSYDVIILDLMLPGMDGLEVCQKLRSDNIHTPILILTAKSQVSDRVRGLNAGADDYLPKPFAFEELLARISALTRRPHTQLGAKLEHYGVMMDTASFEVTVKGKPTALSSKEYALLEYLLRHKGTVLSKEQMIEHVWDYDADILPNTVEVYIKKLRAKGIAIETIRGFGYKLGGEHV